MTAVLRAELLKLRTTRTVLGYVLAAAGLTLLGVVGLSIAAGRGAEVSLADAAIQSELLLSGGIVSLITAFLGSVVLSGEHRHHTIVPTLLVTPSRGRVVAAGAVATALVGAALGVFAMAVSLVAGLASLSLAGVAVAVTAGDLAGPVAGVVVSSALSALFGYGVGGVVRNQATGVAVVALTWFALQPLVGLLWPEGAEWTPGALAGVVEAGQLSGDPGALVAGAAFAAWGVVAAAAAAVRLDRGEAR